MHAAPQDIECEAAPARPTSLCGEVGDGRSSIAVYPAGADLQEPALAGKLIERHGENCSDILTGRVSPATV